MSAKSQWGVFVLLIVALTGGDRLGRYELLNRGDRGVEIEAQLDEIGKTRYVSHFTRATVALARNDHETALDLIEASRDSGEYESVIMMEGVEIFAPLRSHPRYRRHLELMGIPEGVVAGATD